jgi:phosphatidylinositol glycan class A protein
VKDVLNRGHIFLNCSLTESFCIAILEAACCNLLVVSTNVGGVPEVLPSRMAYLAEPSEKDLYRQVINAIKNIGDIDTSTFHNELKGLYSW